MELLAHVDMSPMDSEGRQQMVCKIPASEHRPKQFAPSNGSNMIYSVYKACVCRCPFGRIRGLVAQVAFCTACTNLLSGLSNGLEDQHVQRAIGPKVVRPKKYKVQEIQGVKPTPNWGVPGCFLNHNQFLPPEAGFLLQYQVH